MLANIYFVVEGETDRDFLKDFIKMTFNIDLSEDNFLVTGGYNLQWIHQNRPKLEEAKSIGLTPVLFLDADKDYKSRVTEVAKQISDEELKFDYFVFPDNKSNGDLEEAVLRLSNPKHSQVLKCFEDYKGCLGAYPKPDNKAKLFAYLEAVFPSKKKRRKLNFGDPELWQISAASFPELRTFLGRL